MRLAAAEEAVKRNANAAEKVRLTAKAKEMREADEADKARLALELESDNSLIHNINNLGQFLRCIGFEGTPESNAVYWVGMSNSSDFRFPRWDGLDAPENQKFVFEEASSAFLFYYNNNQPDPFIDNMQYIGDVNERDSSYRFNIRRSVAAYSAPLAGIHTTIDRKSGILKFLHTSFGVSDKYNCSPVSETDKEKIFTKLYRNLHNYAFHKYDKNLKYLKSEKAKKKF